MAWQSGMAANHNDLVAQLRTFLEGVGWSVDSYIEGGNSVQLVVSSPGESGLHAITVGYRSFIGGTDIYNIQTWSGPLWLGGDFTSQPGQSPFRYLCCWNNDTPYWFIADLDRIIVVANVNLTFRMSYHGIIKTFTSVGHWPSPLCCSADTNVMSTHWTAQGNSVCSLQWYRDAASAAVVRAPDTNWSIVNNPFPGNAGAAAWTGMYNNPENRDVQLFQYMAINTTYGSAYGEYKGVFYGSGQFYGAGAIMDDPNGGDGFLFVPNIYRLGVRDFCLVELV